MRPNLLHCLPLSFLLLVIVSLSAWGQTGSGVVKGTALDASGAVIPEAKVTLTNQVTNIIRQTQTSGNGMYYFAQIPPGPYTLVIEHPGFKMWSGELVVHVGQTVVIDPTLQVGNAKTTVEVIGAAPAINTEGMEVADVKDARFIHELPLNGRAVTTLFALTPGVEGGGSPRVNGMKVGGTQMLQDGMSIVDRFGGGISQVQPGLDTVQEFRIETNGSSAKYVEPTTVILLTKSGTNVFHGSAFETYRGNGGGLRARARQDGNVPAKLVRNEFGPSAGGPVYLPRLYDGRNKTFWFASYEGFRNREQDFVDDYVPTEAMWNGDFSQVVDNNGNRTHIYDPRTTDSRGLRQPFPGDIIPPDRISALYKFLHSVTHKPTDLTNPFQGTNLHTFYPLKTGENKLTIRVDQRVSGKDYLSVRFTRDSRDFVQTGNRFGNPPQELTNAGGTGFRRSVVYNTVVNETHSFTPNVLIESLFGLNRNPNHQGTLADFTDWPTQLGLPNPFNVLGWPTISAGFPGNEWDADNKKDQNFTQFQIDEHLTVIKGRHTFIFGGRYRREHNDVQELQQAQGSHSFGSAWTSLYDPIGDQPVTFTGVGLASMALGLPTSLSNQFNRGFFFFRQTQEGLYFQDAWKVSPRLTLQLGMRWDRWTPYDEANHRLLNIDLAKVATQFQVVTPDGHPMESLPGVPSSVLASWAQRGLTWTTAGQAGLPTNLLPADNDNFGPRLGAAFRLNNKTVLRGGYGVYYWTMPLSQILQAARTDPPLNLRYTNPIGSFDGTSSYAIRTAPQPNFFIGTATVDTSGIVKLPVNAQPFYPWDVRDWKDSKAQEWNVTLEREFWQHAVLKLHYIGDHGSGLEQRFALNEREPAFNYIARTGQTPPANRDLLRVNPNWSFSGTGAENHTGYSNTHSAQVEIDRRFGNGLGFQWFYVFTRSLTTSDAGGSTSGNGSINATNGVFTVPEHIQLFGEPSASYDQRLRLGYYNSTNIPRHRMTWNAIYALPFGTGQRWGESAGRSLNALIGGWQISTIGTWRSGLWSSVSPSEWVFRNPQLDPSQRLLLTFNGRPQRLYFAGDFDPTRASNVSQTALQALVPLDRSQRAIHPLGPRLDNTLPQVLATGSTTFTSIGDLFNWSPRAFFLGPRAWNVDAALVKYITIKGSTRIRIEGDFFNAFNHPNDVSPNGSTGLQDLSQQANEPRIIQLSLRLEW